MTTLYFILYLLSAVCFLIATIQHYRPAREGVVAKPLPNLVALGLLLWVLVPLIVTARAL